MRRGSHGCETQVTAEAIKGTSKNLPNAGKGDRHMSMSDYLPKADLWTGLAIGVGLLVAPVVIPIAAHAARPLLKTMIKGGFLAYERASEIVAEAMETVEDVAAEAKSEVYAELVAAKQEKA